MGLEKILPYANSKKATDNARDISELSAQGTVTKRVFLTESEYAILENADEVDPNTEYNIYADPEV